MADSNKTEKFLNNFLLLALVLGLFAIGGHLISLEIPFWSLFLGIASIQIGIVLSIFSFDIISRRASKPITEEYKAIPCLVCKTMTFVPKYKKTTICDDCQVRIASAAKPLLVAIFAIFSLGALVSLTRVNQDIRKQAKESAGYYCEPWDFSPEVCSCGVASQESCNPGEISRECSDGKIYCCTSGENDTIDWSCEQKQ